MSYIRKQIGWSNESNLLWELLKKLDRLIGVTGSSTGGGSSTVELADSTQLDAFGRLRVSDEYTLADYKNIYGPDVNLLQLTGNGGSSTYSFDQSLIRLGLDGTPSGFSICQSKMYHNYMAGKSQLIYISFNLNAAVATVTKDLGYFDAENGIFLRQAGDGTLSIVLRTSTSGSMTETVVGQSSWNVDKCNGTGASTFNIDITKTQLLYIDFQWLAVGRVRVGFVHDGQAIVAHEFLNSNNLAIPYMSKPNLPVRAEIYGDAEASMDYICSTVISEGGYSEAGIDWSHVIDPLVSVASGATVPLLAIRLKDNFNTYPKNRMIVRLQDFNITSTNQPLVYRLLKLPNEAALTTATGWVSVSTSGSGVEYNDGATAINYALPGVDILTSGYVSAAQSSKSALTQGSSSSARKNYIAQNYDSTDSEIYVIEVTNGGTNSTDVGISMQWREIY